MAKKRRVNTKNVASTVNVETEAMTGNLPVATRTNKDVFDPDYSYVIKNLKKIATLAVIFIAILVILSFII